MFFGTWQSSVSVQSWPATKIFKLNAIKTENLPSAWTFGIPEQQHSSFLFQAPAIILSVTLIPDTDMIGAFSPFLYFQPDAFSEEGCSSWHRWADFQP